MLGQEEERVVVSPRRDSQPILDTDEGTGHTSRDTALRRDAQLFLLPGAHVRGADADRPGLGGGRQGVDPRWGAAVLWSDPVFAQRNSSDCPCWRWGCRQRRGAERAHLPGNGALGPTEQGADFSEARGLWGPHLSTSGSGR